MARIEVEPNAPTTVPAEARLWLDARAPAAGEVEAWRDAFSADADAIAALPEREKLVIALYYYENLTLREIGEVLGVTESRISQLHTKAVLRLKSRLQGDNLRD